MIRYKKFARFRRHVNKFLNELKKITNKKGVKITVNISQNENADIENVKNAFIKKAKELYPQLLKQLDESNLNIKKKEAIKDTKWFKILNYYANL